VQHFVCPIRNIQLEVERDREGAAVTGVWVEHRDVHGVVSREYVRLRSRVVMA